MTIASITFVTSRACVPCSLADSIDREPFPVRICARLRWRAHGEINPGLNRTRNPASHQSVAPLSSGCGNWIAALSSLGSVLARSLSCPNLARFWPLNLTGYLSRWSSLRSLVQDPQKSASISNVLFSPKALSIRAAHTEQHAWSSLKCLTNALKGQSR